jgi:hypothetical protein
MTIGGWVVGTRIVFKKKKKTESKEKENIFLAVKIFKV